MSKYEVTIQHTITKTYTVSALDKSEAIEWVYLTCSILKDGTLEDQDISILNIDEVK